VTAYLIYSQLPSISQGCLLQPQPENVPCRGDRAHISEDIQDDNNKRQNLGNTCYHAIQYLSSCILSKNFTLFLYGNKTSYVILREEYRQLKAKWTKER
jgi:hypothetical protein